MPGRMSKDIVELDYKDVVAQVETDQEYAMVVLWEAVRLKRQSPIMATNGPVGGSECNGRAEVAIRRTHEKF